MRAFSTCLHDALNLHTSVVITGNVMKEMLDQALENATRPVKLHTFCKELQSRLSTMNISAVQDFHRSARMVCRIKTRRFPER